MFEPVKENSWGNFQAGYDGATMILAYSMPANVGLAAYIYATACSHESRQNFFWKL